MKRKNFYIFLVTLLFSVLLATGLCACGRGESAPVALSAPQISLQENVISWSAVEHADGYAVFEGENKVSAQTATTFTVEKIKAGEYKFTVVATSANGDYTDSAPSNEVVYTLEQTIALAAPVVTLRGTELTWTAVEHADFYEVYADGAKVATVQTTSYTATQSRPGEYKYCVRAVSSAEYDPSPMSNEVTCTIGENGSVKLATPEVTLSGNILSWSPVPHATEYVIYSNGDYYMRTTATSINVSRYEVGTYEYAVVATSDNALYAQSEKSEIKTFVVNPQKLATPVLTLDGFLLKWDEVEHAGLYNIYEDGEKIATQADCNYMITYNEPITCEYTVEAAPAKNDNQYVKSDMSEPIVFALGNNRQPVGTPTVEIEYGEVDEEGNKEPDFLVWTAVDNAEAYDIYEDGKRIFSTNAERRFQLTIEMPGTHNYQVRAVARGLDYMSGELSESAEYVIPTNDEENFVIGFNIPNGFSADTQLTVGLFTINSSNGLPQSKVGEQTVKASETATIVAPNNVYYMAKITGEPPKTGESPETGGLPTGCYASECRVYAGNTFGTINIYSMTTSRLLVTGENSFTASAHVQGSTTDGPNEVGVTQTGFVFVAQKAGKYTISTQETKPMIINLNGIPVIEISQGGGRNVYTFTADANEAIEISVVGGEVGRFVYTISEGAQKQYIEVCEGYGMGAANAIFDGETHTTRYMNVDRTRKYTFFFTTPTMSNTRFVIITINGVQYEFDGISCSQNILIEAGTDIEITIDMSGSSADEGLSTVYFFVYPVG